MCSFLPHECFYYHQVLQKSKKFCYSSRFYLLSNFLATWMKFHCSVKDSLHFQQGHLSQIFCDRSWQIFSILYRDYKTLCNSLCIFVALMTRLFLQSGFACLSWSFKSEAVVREESQMILHSFYLNELVQSPSVKRIPRSPSVT